jgi:hypothetical protein
MALKLLAERQIRCSATSISVKKPAQEHIMSKGLHATKTGEIVYVTPLGGNHYRLDYSDGRVTFI